MISLTWVDSTGGQLLLTGNQVRVLRGVQGLDALPTANVWEERATFDGSALMSRRRPVRSLVLPLAIIGSNPQGLLRDVLRRFQLGGRLEATIEGSTRVLFECEFEGAADQRDAGTVGAAFRKVVVNLTAGDPWWRGPVESNPLKFNVETPFDDVTVPFDDVNTPFDGGDTTPFFVDGDVSAFPELFITGPFTDVSITNSLTGQSIQTDTAIAAGEVLVVDSRPTSRGPRFQGDDRPDWSLITPASRLFELQAGGNVLAVGASGDGAGSAVEVRWRSRFATP